MGVVSGAISLKDNATAVLKSIKDEQSSFRKDVKDTRKELTSTWDKQYKAKIEATAAMKKTKDLKSKLEPLRKKVVTAVAMKDNATAKVKKITNQVKSVGKMVAKPVVNVVVKGANALSAVGKGIAKAGKAAAIGLGAVAAVGSLALGAVFSGSLEAATAALEAEAQLTQVMKNTMDATEETVKSVLDLAEAQENIGVVSADVQISGMQELGTYVGEAESLKTLMPVMNDMLAQQYGLNASQENAVQIATMMGKVLNGQVGGLSKLGYSFTEAQEKILKFGTEEQKAATLAEVISESVGGMNEALADTDLGKIKQMENAYGKIKEEVGRVGITLKAQLAGVISKNLPTISKLGNTLTGVISKFADIALPILDSAISKVTPMVEGALSKVGDIAEELAPILSDIFGGLSDSAKTVKPILSSMIKGFKPLMPQLLNFGSVVFSTVQKVATAALPVITGIITTIQNVIPAVLPVLETVIMTIGNVISQAAPIISGMVEGIGVVITTLAPIFSTIFGEIGEKVGSVIGFVGERMGFIQEVIGTVAPLVGDIISTAWGVISPVMDLVISAFKLVFNVVQKVFPGIQKVMEGVWAVIKPIVEGVGWVVKNIADGIGWLAAEISGNSGGEIKAAEHTNNVGQFNPQKVGTNADGDNNWRGGLTWVGEKGPELVDLPKGSKILPNKESVQLTKPKKSGEGTVKDAGKGVLSALFEKPKENGEEITLLKSIEKGVSIISQQFARKEDRVPLPQNREPFKNRADGLVKKIVVNITKLADSIVVREEADIDKIANAVAKKVVDVAVNMG